jgi:hypothetical protein
MKRKVDWKKFRKEVAKAGAERARYEQAISMLRNYSTEKILFGRLMETSEELCQYTENTLKKIEPARKIDWPMMEIVSIFYKEIEDKKVADQPKKNKKKEDLLYENFLTALKAFQVYVEHGLRRKKAAEKIGRIRKGVTSIYRQEIKSK